jgi:hypothetical protein
MSGNAQLSTILAIEDILGSIVMLWAALRITTRAGFHDAQARWALFRRAVYCVGSIALFDLGVLRLHGSPPVADIEDMLCHTVVLGVVLIFPLMRAFNWITQDAFDVFQGLRPSSRDHR